MDMLKPGGLSSSSKHFVCHILFINTDYMFRSHSPIRSVLVWLGFTNVPYRSRARTQWLLSHHRGPHHTFTRHARKELSQKSPLWKVAKDPQKMCQGTLPHTESSESLILKNILSHLWEGESFVKEESGRTIFMSLQRSRWLLHHRICALAASNISPDNGTTTSTDVQPN